LRAGSKSVTINGQDVKIGGDIITAIDGQPVTSIEELKVMLSQFKSDQEMSLTLLRDGKDVEVTVMSGK
jgi:serine protease Do